MLLLSWQPQVENIKLYGEWCHFQAINFVKHDLCLLGWIYSQFTLSLSWNKGGNEERKKEKINNKKKNLNGREIKGKEKKAKEMKKEKEREGSKGGRKIGCKERRK